MYEDVDKIYIQNHILSLLKQLSFYYEKGSEITLPTILEGIFNLQIQDGLLKNTQSQKDILQSKLLDAMMPRPHEVIYKFETLRQQSPKKASQYFYGLSKKSHYIQEERVALDIKWTTQTKYGELDITINRSKPEKDPKDIAESLTRTSSTYPKCLLCKENEGFEGNTNLPARSNHRLIPLHLNNQGYMLQYSPYVYYNEHCIVLNQEHIPMVINKDTFTALLDFVDILPHYFIGSNADLPIVGGSILTHDHFQGGHYEFAMNRAKQLDIYKSRKYSSVEYGRLYWPLSVIKATSRNKAELLLFMEDVLQHWIEYTNEGLGIHAYTDGVRHNTITPIVRKHNDMYECNLVLRNNRTSEEYPDGIFHPHRNLHHIKKENIGLIEVLGLAILPSRLIASMDHIKHSLIANNINLDANMTEFQSWYVMLYEKYDKSIDIDKFLNDEIGYIFEQVLEDCGVFKQDKQGQDNFIEFLNLLEK